jgi:hypothetical protein
MCSERTMTSMGGGEGGFGISTDGCLDSVLRDMYHCGVEGKGTFVDPAWE